MKYRTIKILTCFLALLLFTSLALPVATSEKAPDFAKSIEAIEKQPFQPPTIQTEQTVQISRDDAQRRAGITQAGEDVARKYILTNPIEDEALRDKLSSVLSSFARNLLHLDYYIEQSDFERAYSFYLPLLHDKDWLSSQGIELRKLTLSLDNILHPEMVERYRQSDVYLEREKNNDQFADEFNFNRPIGRRSIQDDRFSQGGIFEGFSPQDEILDKRTFLSKKFRVDSERISTFIGGPFHYEDEFGALQDVDLTIRPDDDGEFGYYNDENRFKSYFSSVVDGGVRLEYKGHFIEYGVEPTLTTAQAVPKGMPSVSTADSIISYDDIFDGAKLEYIVNRGHVKQWLTINDRSLFDGYDGDFVVFSERFRIPRRTTLSDSIGIFTTRREISGIAIISSEDEALFGFDPARVWDASFTDNPRFHPVGENIIQPRAYIERISGLEYEYSVAVPVEWLLADERIYPVVIDPTVTVPPGATFPDYGYPWRTNEFYTRACQYIYHSSDIGYTGNIESIAFHQSAANGRTNTNVWIQMKHTTATEHGFPNVFETGMTNCNTAATFDWTSGTGWRTMSFGSSFSYSTASNLLVETHHYISWLSGTGGGWYYIADAGYYGHRWGTNTSSTYTWPLTQGVGGQTINFGSNVAVCRLDINTGPDCCIAATSYGSATAPTDNTEITIATGVWAGEYNTISSVVSGRTYRFRSSNSSDFLTLTDASNNCITDGTTPLTWTATYSGTVRLHVHTNSACGTATVSRTTYIQCTSCAASETCCIAPTEYGSNPAPTDDVEINVASWIFVNEYTTITSVVAGETYRFQVRDAYGSTNSTDWLSLTNVSNNCLAYGTSTIFWTATFSGTVRLHLHNGPSCGTGSLPDRHVYVLCTTCSADCDCDYAVPFSGNNTITASSGTICDHNCQFDYDNNADGYTVIHPSISGYMVRLNFIEFNTELGWDAVMLYDGPNTSSPIISSGSTYGRATCPNGAWTGSAGGAFVPTVITSTAGPLTIRFLSDGSVVRPGFEAVISNVPGTTDPCLGITSIGGCGSGYTQTANMSGSGAWDVTACGYNTPGQELIYSFTAPITGTYSIEVTSASGGWVDFFWKTGACNSSGWNCISDVFSAGTYGSMSWTAGTTYLIQIAGEGTGAYSYSFYINCPAACSPIALTSNVPVTTSSYPEHYEYYDAYGSSHVVAIAPHNEDHDIAVYTAECQGGSLLSSSTFGGLTVDYVIGGWRLPAGTFYPTAYYNVSATNPSTIEYEQSGWVDVNVPHTSTFNYTHAIETFEVYLVNGNTYNFSLEVHGGGCDLGFGFGLPPEEGWLNRPGMIVNVDSYGIGGDESYTGWLCTETGDYTIVVFNNRSVSYSNSNFTLLVSQCVTPGEPISLSATPTSGTSANLSWSAGTPAGSPTVTYYWSVGESPSHTYSSGYTARGTTTGTTASTSALACGTTYYLRVYAQTSCDGSSSGTATSASFNTPPCCTAPTSVTASASAVNVCAGNSVTLQYITHSGGSCSGSWQYEWRTSGGTIVRSWNTTADFTWAAPVSGTYHLYMRCSDCTGDVSPASNAVAIDIFNDEPIGTWTGYSNNDWDNPQNWGQCEVPTATMDVHIPAAPTYGRFPTVNTATGSCICRNMVNDGTINGSIGELHVFGDWVNNGTFNRNSSVVVFDGDDDQVIRGTNETAFFNIRVPKTTASIRQDINIWCYGRLNMLYPRPNLWKMNDNTIHYRRE